MKIRICKGFVITVVLLAGVLPVQSGRAEDIPQPELGCRLLDAEGNPLDRADQMFQQRLQVTRCMNSAERERESQSRLQKSQLQTIENVRNARRAETEFSRLGYGMPGNPYRLPQRASAIPIP